MRTAISIGAILSFTACHAQLADLGGSSPDGGMMEHGGGDGSSVTPGVDVCKGAGATREAGAGGGVGGGVGGDGGAPQSCTPSSQCTAPDVCILLPGLGSEGFCGAQCESDCDCPAWLTCQSGVCSSQCSSSACPTGQACSVVATPPPSPCQSNSDCELGTYCDPFATICTPYEVCTDCFGNCPTCTVNSQCEPGQVCAGGTCTTCSSDSQCGPSAICTAIHQGVQCTCTSDSDCQSGETCSSGLCGGGEIVGCALNGCPSSQACISNVCGPCGTFADCNQVSFSGATQSPTGFACIDGVCSACTANSQCGGGQACIGGTCGTCSTNEQCGPSGDCMSGFCVCSSDAQCASGQRCGAGVCVEM
jgi:hypothetical protein